MHHTASVKWVEAESEILSLPTFPKSKDAKTLIWLMTWQDEASASVVCRLGPKRFVNPSASGRILGHLLANPEQL